MVNSRRAGYMGVEMGVGQPSGYAFRVGANPKSWGPRVNQVWSQQPQNDIVVMGVFLKTESITEGKPGLRSIPI